MPPASSSGRARSIENNGRPTKSGAQNRPGIGRTNHGERRGPEIFPRRKDLPGKDDRLTGKELERRKAFRRLGRKWCIENSPSRRLVADRLSHVMALLTAHQSTRVRHKSCMRLVRGAILE